LRTDALELLGRIAGRTGCKLIAQGASARMERGAGRVPLARIPYVVDLALAMLKEFRHLILVEAKDPVAFFGYPGKPSLLRPQACEAMRLSHPGEDSLAALAALADAVGATAGDAPRQAAVPGQRPTGAITPDSLAHALGHLMPENAIVVDESITTGRGFYAALAGAAPHDWLQNLGGSIGYSTPVGTGAAVACPDRRVVCLTGDGSAMYTIQSLWTQARENLDVTTVIFANRTYQILKGELAHVGAGNPGRKALDMLDIDRPTLDFVALARGMGVEGRRVETIDEFCDVFSGYVAERGPRLIEVVV
jgi:acetolactate synthase-1/2/3 large subunit